MWKPRVTVAAIVERENKFLIVEENIDGQLMLNQPAGHWEDNETLIEAVIRETREETAWQFTPSHLVGIYQWKHPSTDDTYLRFAFAGNVYQHDESQPLDQGIVQAVWLSRDEILAREQFHRSPQLMMCIDDYLAGKNISLNALIVV